MTRPADPLSRLIAHAQALVLPSACAGCAATCANVLCAECASCLQDDGRLRCARCALPLAGARSSAAGSMPTVPVPVPVPQALCGHCVASPPTLDAALCVADYAEPADSFVLALKFRGRLALAGCLAALLAERVHSTRIALPDVIAPIPLSSRRLVERGYNQAWEIARPFARRIRRPATARLLIRTRDTLAQAELSGAQRRRNMRRAFAVAQPAAVHGRHVGIVDDVMTSGATLDAAARALKYAGAARVTAFVVLRTP